MKWTTTNYPVSMKNLPVEVRTKAIEIGNMLVNEKNMDEAIAIVAAINRAKIWAQQNKSQNPKS